MPDDKDTAATESENHNAEPDESASQDGASDTDDGREGANPDAEPATKPAQGVDNSDVGDTDVADGEKDDADSGDTDVADPEGGGDDDKDDNDDEDEADPGDIEQPAARWPRRIVAIVDGKRHVVGYRYRHAAVVDLLGQDTNNKARIASRLMRQRYFFQETDSDGHTIYARPFMPAVPARPFEKPAESGEGKEDERSTPFFRS